VTNAAQKRTGRGFTLIEILIVVTIVGIMAAAIILAINPAKRNKQARDATRKSDIGQIANALKAYFTNYGTYPSPSGPGSASLTALVFSGDLKQIPLDPLGAEYSYTVSGTGDSAEAAVYGTVEDPTSGTGNWVWCFRTASVSIGEVTSGNCIP
jgi:general secretion pathway protein G